MNVTERQIMFDHYNCINCTNLKYVGKPHHIFLHMHVFINMLDSGSGHVLFNEYLVRSIRGSPEGVHV